MSPRPRVLLAYRTLGLGDLLTALPALRGLRRAYPGHVHVLAAPAWLAPLVSAVPEIDEHVPVDELAPVPLTAPADVAVNLHGSGPESHRVVQRAAGSRPIAFRHPDIPWSAVGPAWNDDEHEVHRWCRLLSEHGIGADPDDLDLEVSHTPGEPAGSTVIHPGAKSVARRWPVERYAAVARREAARGRRVVITGSSSERGLAEAVARAAGLDGRAVLAGSMDLGALAGLVAVADVVVCGDTGMAHLATAVGAPSVVLFGPTDPRHWGPPPDRAHLHRVLWAGRIGDPHATRPDPGLLMIGVDEVLAALDALHATGRRAPGRPVARHARKWTAAVGSGGERDVR